MYFSSLDRIAAEERSQRFPNTEYPFNIHTGLLCFVLLWLHHQGLVQYKGCLSRYRDSHPRDKTLVAVLSSLSGFSKLVRRHTYIEKTQTFGDSCYQFTRIRLGMVPETLHCNAAPHWLSPEPEWPLRWFLWTLYDKLIMCVKFLTWWKNIYKVWNEILWL